MIKSIPNLLNEIKSIMALPLDETVVVRIRVDLRLRSHRVLSHGAICHDTCPVANTVALSAWRVLLIFTSVTLKGPDCGCVDMVHFVMIQMGDQIVEMLSRILY